uniref:Adenine phosphoribosyltransferase (Apt) n=1 Tax=uncultured marine group II/III euryarchaeote KM3_05_F04 TaxID=1457838 RepID=A0A075G4E1_9EURY|nr:adenine phosphoribosyltransferase (apt) [uncultured marine group II/III euryarchaeote KM3_05_F04]
MSPPDSSDGRIVRLRQSVLNAPVVWKDDYAYFVHPLTDGVPRQSAVMLQEARDIVLEMVDWEQVDLILGIEAMGIPLASTLSIATGKPLVIARKRPYGLPGEVVVDQSTGYSKGSIYLNDVNPGDRIFIIDDVVSTGGTLRAVLSAVESAGAILQDVIIVFEKGNKVDELVAQTGWPLRSLVKLRMDGDKVVLL